MALFVTGALAFAVDLATKQLVLRLHQDRLILPRPLFRIRVLINSRGALGHVISAPALVLLWAATVTGLLVVAHQGHLFDATAARIGLGAALGGATGNVVDRLWRGGVVDFIDLRFWPVFNLADCAIVGGIVLTLAFVR